VNGLALGGGLELALAADCLFAADTAEFALPEVKIGTIPGWGGTSRLRDLIGSARAKEMIFSGRRIDAQTAENWGLVNRTVPAEKLIDEAVTSLKEMAQNAPISVQLSKELVNADLAGADARVLEGIAAGLAAHTEDGQEGINAFKTRRPARFSGR
jgi:enoyl-CoA hydratase/carnithine racemase